MSDFCFWILDSGFLGSWFLVLGSYHTHTHTLVFWYWMDGNVSWFRVEKDDRPNPTPTTFFQRPCIYLLLQEVLVTLHATQRAHSFLYTHTHHTHVITCIHTHTIYTYSLLYIRLPCLVYVPIHSLYSSLFFSRLSAFTVFFCSLTYGLFVMSMILFFFLTSLSLFLSVSVSVSFFFVRYYLLQRFFFMPRLDPTFFQKKNSFLVLVLVLFSSLSPLFSSRSFSLCRMVFSYGFLAEGGAMGHNVHTYIHRVRFSFSSLLH